ncbi:MAG: three-Cys-motif partner protein TcmP [Planctomycetota bacterium]|nr:three-Cys-motif partner protein TcmP [Planctomycetota bacterium]
MPTIDNDEFYKEQKEHSYIKSCIVSDYFWAWANVMIGVQNRYANRPKRLAYIDLFCGPGKYDDGTDSTPLMIMRRVLNRPELRDRLLTVFNDRLPKNTAALEAALAALPGIDQLKFKPQIFTGEVDESVVKQLEAMKLPPTFLFVDPFGYKGLSLRLINSVLKHWGCDCVFFFNYNRVNAGMGHKGVKNHLDEIFGEERANRIRQRFSEQSVKVNAREAFIVDEMKCALEEMGGKFVLPFRFRDPEEKRTTHHLFFVSKDFLGYKIMREIMHTNSHKSEAVAKFEYNPAEANLPSLFNLLRPLADLEDLLLADCAGKTFLIDELFEFHSVGKPYVLKEYKEVVSRLADEGMLTLDSGGKKRRAGTVGEKVKIIFPRRDQ